jgi:N-acetyl sugar amidotransferase
MKKHFLYDGLILFDGTINHLKKKIVLIKKNFESNFLAITFNHRRFSLREINNIRSEIENMDIDHMMFSIRPSYKVTEVKKFNFFFQIIFAIKVAQTHGIKKIFITDEYKTLIEKNKNNILFRLNNYLKDILKKSKKNKNETLTFFKSINLDNIKGIEFMELPKPKKDNVPLKIYKDINYKNKNIFWLGFDRNFQEVPWTKPYEKDFWYSYAKKIRHSDPFFKKMKYCTRCCLPETWEGIKFDKVGICSICKSSEDKMNIEWINKEIILRKIFSSFKNKNYYDCLLPISGGKDSTFQSYVLTKKYKLNPLAVTHGQNWFSLTGRENLENCLNKFDLDHIFICPSRNKINNVAKQSLEKIGDSCWHCHIGAGTFAIQISFDWKIGLIIYGEAPSDTDARGSFKKNNEHVSVYRFLKESAIENNKKFISKEYNIKKLSNWSYPDGKELLKFNPKIIHLGQYIFWDEQKNVDFVSKHFGWKNTRVENTYKGYKSNECVMAGVHDYLNFLKRGIGRASVHASEDARRGLITKEQGHGLIKKFDMQKPHALTYYKKITGFNDNSIKKNIVKARQKSKYARKFKY